MPALLCLVVDRSASALPLEQAVDQAFRAGADWLQLRERALEGAAWFDWARTLRDAARRGAAARGGEAIVIVNRRIDIALAIEADGVHLGFDALAPPEARALLGPEARIGVSCHEPSELASASGTGADYAHLAPVFDPRSKVASRPPLGLAGLRACAAFDLPVFAQGGIDASNAAGVIAAGATGVAVTGAILQSEQPGAETEVLRRALDD